MSKRERNQLLAHRKKVPIRKCALLHRPRRPWPCPKKLAQRGQHRGAARLEMEDHLHRSTWEAATQLGRQTRTLAPSRAVCGMDTAPPQSPTRSPAAPHQQREGKGVEGAVGGIVDAEVPGPQLDQAHQRTEPPLVLHQTGRAAAGRAVNTAQYLGTSGARNSAHHTFAAAHGMRISPPAPAGPAPPT